MTTETLYRPKGAGHSAPGGDRRRYIINDRLVALANEWLDKAGLMGGFVGVAENMVRRHFPGRSGGLSGVSNEEINYVQVVLEGHPKGKVGGTLLSALYNMSPLDELMYDDAGTGIVLDYLGSGLPRRKKLIIKSRTGKYTGAGSKGTIVNHADGANIGDEDGCPGTVVSFGRDCNIRNTNGLLLNFGSYTSFRVRNTPAVFMDFQFRDHSGRPTGTGSIHFYSNIGALESLKGREEHDRSGLRLSADETDKIPGLHRWLFMLREALGPGSSDQDVFRGMDMLRDFGTYLRGAVWMGGGYKEPLREPDYPGLEEIFEGLFEEKKDVDLIIPGQAKPKEVEIILPGEAESSWSSWSNIITPGDPTFNDDWDYYYERDGLVFVAKICPQLYKEVCDGKYVGLEIGRESDD